MRRIYLESFLGLIILFLASLKGYELIVYELNTDYDYLLQEHSSQAFYDLLSPIYEEKGLEYTKSELEKFATASHRLLQPHTMDELPPEVKEVFDEDPTANIAFDD
ncbi:two-component sensor histidine kinase, partial [Vibrio sp. Vb1574]|nr:two-component sensor histidine kinase [Vibrio sp. Vb1574]